MLKIRDWAMIWATGYVFPFVYNFQLNFKLVMIFHVHFPSHKQLALTPENEDKS